MYKFVLSVIFAVLSINIFTSTQTVGALSSDPTHFVGSDNTFFVYVKAGERISAQFILSQHVQEAFPSDDVTVTMNGPDAKQKKCVLKKDDAVGSGCVFAAQTATKSGIWTIVFDPGDRARAHKEASADVLWIRNLYTWKIMVTNADGEQKGRAWSDRYSFRQPPGSEFTSDFTTHYVSQDGYIYRAIHHDYNGQISILSADSIGIRKDKECISAYQSAPVDNDILSPALGSCGNQYKLFFEEPSGSLPAESILPDESEEWVRPAIKKPEISELHFTGDDTDDQLSGDVTFFLRNFIGQYQVKIDVDNDGSFDGQNDVTLFEQMKELSTSLQKVHFQGVDKQGQIIAPSEKIGIKVEITKVAEIHFVAVDVEGRGGLELVRVNGANAPNNRLCWNDTELVSLANSALMTPELDGRACFDSAGGVHGWKYNSKSWGNARYIDDWIYATAKIDGSNIIVYPEDEEKTVASAEQGRGVLLIGVAVVSIMVVVGVVVIVMKRRSKRGAVDSNITPPDPPLPPTGTNLGQGE